jgi:hypothetical protein
MKQISLITITVLLTLLGSQCFSESKTPKFQVGLTHAIYDILVDESTDFFDIYDEFRLQANGIRISYIYSPYTSMGASLYRAHSCSQNSSDSSAECVDGGTFLGTSLELLTGYNMNKSGVFIYTGVRYYWENSDKSGIGSPTIPIAIGYRYRGVSVETGMEFRDEYSDISDFGIIDTGGTAESVPFQFALSYQF